MTFEILDKDLWGRIGKLTTNSGTIETPALFPVINSIKQEIPINEIKNAGFNQIITNAYLLKRHYGDLVREVGVHKFLNWDGPIMTDSGAYQLLMYGRVDITPDEVLKYEVEIGTDIGVILDIPTQWGRPRDIILLEVEETLRRARRALEKLKEWDPDHKMLIVGPIQGGDKLDILAYSARSMSKLNYDIYAIGSPTTLLEEYDFLTITKMIITVKKNIPPGKPVHLFGAGHPLILPLAVALGVDLFDSASYMLYARDDRVILRDRTVRLKDLKVDRIPCNCPVCRRYTVKELMEMNKVERERLLAIHNLYVLWEELQEIKARIREGTLWEYLEEKSAGDARLRSAFIRAGKDFRKLLKLIPVTSGRVKAMHITTEESFMRPEVLVHIRRLFSNYKPPNKPIVLVLPGDYLERPYLRDSIVQWILNEFLRNELIDKVHLVIQNPVLGPIPYELSEVYPLSQHEYPSPVPTSIKLRALKLLLRYLSMLKNYGYRTAIILMPRNLPSSLIKHANNIGLNIILIQVYSRESLMSQLPWVLSKLCNYC